MTVQLNEEESNWPVSRLKLVHRTALIHEVVPTVYTENRRLRGVIRLLEEQAVSKDAEVKRLRNALNTHQ